jgi:hypothetical protein
MAKHYLCGTPPAECYGSYTDTSARASEAAKQKMRKMHSTREEAFKCHCRYLLRTGHKRVGPREFETPHGSVLVLTKKSHFGGELKRGKSEGGKGTRFMPKTPNLLIV